MNSKIFAVLALFLLLASSSFAQVYETISLESTFIHNSPGQNDVLGFSQGYEPTSYSVTFDARYLTITNYVSFDSWVNWNNFHYFERHETFTTPGMYCDTDSRMSESLMGTTGIITNHYSGAGATGTSYVTTKISRQVY